LRIERGRWVVKVMYSFTVVRGESLAFQFDVEEGGDNEYFFDTIDWLRDLVGQVRTLRLESASARRALEEAAEKELFGTKPDPSNVVPFPGGQG
jgi:hypothetical protein